MLRKYFVVMAFLLVSCGSPEQSYTIEQLEAYDKSALEQFAAEGKYQRVIEIVRAKEQFKIAHSSDYMVLADIYLKLLNGNAAEAAVEKAREEGAIKPNTALRMGSAYTLQRRLDEAKEELRLVMLTGNDGFEAVMLQADIALQQDQVEESRQFYALARDMQPQNVRVDLGLALLELSENNLDASVSHATTARSKDTENAISDYILGVVSRMRNERQEALKYLENSIRLNPDYIHARLELIAAYLDVGDIESAEQALDKAVEQAASYPLTQFYVAFLQAEKGDLEAAHETLIRTRGLFGVYPAASRLYGLVTYRLEKFEVASNFLQKYLNKNPDDRVVRMALAESLIKTGFPNPALKVLAPLLSGSEVDVSAESAAGTANMAAGNAKAASRNYEKALDFTANTYDPSGDGDEEELARLIVARANSEYFAGNVKEALKVIKSLDEYGLMAPDNLLSIANMQIQEGLFEEALATADKLARTESRKAEAFNIKGSVYYRQGKMEEAVSVLSEALKLVPNYQSALKNRAYAYSAQNKHLEAKADFMVLIKDVQTDGQLYAKLGYTQLHLSDFQAASSNLRKARELIPSSAVVASNYGYALAEQGFYKEAIEQVEAAYILAGYNEGLQKALKETIAEYKEALRRQEQQAPDQ